MTQASTQTPRVKTGIRIGPHWNGVIFRISSVGNLLFPKNHPEHCNRSL
jgi:hypothetical protein